MPMVLTKIKLNPAVYSIIYWPYTLKIFMAPFLDLTISKKIGRRKIWLFPIQSLIGGLLIFIGYGIQDWLNDKNLNFKMVTSVFCVLLILSAIQDTVIDGWALDFLKKENVGYAALCNNCGHAMGVMIGYVVLLLLESESFCNKWLRYTKQSGGIVSFKGFFCFWGVMFIIATVIIGLFKHEKKNNNPTKVKIFQVYGLAWKILNLETIKQFSFVVTTYEIAFAIESIMSAKFLEQGITKDDIVLVDLSLYPIGLIVAFVVAKYTIGPKPMSLFLKVMPYRMIVGILSGVLVYYTPQYVSKDGISSRYFFLIFQIYNIFQRALMIIMRLSILSFFSRVSDSSVGSTYMSILNTLYSLGNACIKTTSFAAISYLTITKCSSNVFCDIFNVCKSFMEECDIIVDGYYVEIALCTVLGTIWYLVLYRTIKNLQYKDLQDWHVNKQTLSKNSQNEKVQTKEPFSICPINVKICGQTKLTSSRYLNWSIRLGVPLGKILTNKRQYVQLF
ncbi:acetyl-coenzyme A transporter 1-like isoform X2 [Daktulosphaira vitifoliae]|uniref:acetyl-coenzyme A transporter 1-like isoform X2 n=1 Tax=Daktulosphaira vitifoliae TaxID=58002 RepID=UPI0021A99C97|nr:acetyl-coenzyme A transporter 1-like isoform X2 [Daktulosphaira vitifoliae]